MAEARNIGMNDCTRWRSTVSMFWLLSMIANSATAAANVTPTTMVDSRAAVITPTASRTTISATTPRAIEAVADPSGPVERVGHLVAGVAEGAAAQQQVLRQPDGHPDRGQAEAPVEALPAPDQTGQQRAEQGAQVDAHVVDGEAAVASLVVRGVHVAQHRAGGRLQRAGAERDADQADPHPGQTGEDGQRDVPEHDQHGRAGQGPLGAEQPVGDPGAEDGAEVDQAAVGADDRGRARLRAARVRPR